MGYFLNQFLYRFVVVLSATKTSFLFTLTFLSSSIISLSFLDFPYKEDNPTLAYSLYFLLPFYIYFIKNFYENQFEAEEGLTKAPYPSTSYQG